MSSTYSEKQIDVYQFMFIFMFIKMLKCNNWALIWTAWQDHLTLSSPVMGTFQ